jgi:hypothetical protein
METDPCENAWASHLECDDARVSRSSRVRKSVVSGKTATRTEVIYDITPCIP